MKPRRKVPNPSLTALIGGAGFSSRQSFADAVNRCGWEMHGLKLAYDHVSVKRWLAGSVCQHPDVVAAVLSKAWGIPIPVAVIWPDVREGTGPPAAHLRAWVAPRTLEGLAVFVRSDMLTRRDILAASVTMAAGQTLVDSIARWFGTDPVSLSGREGTGLGRIGMSAVEGIERSTRQFVATDAAIGGGLAREAAVGQLKYAVDLAQHASYGEAVGSRLLVAIAGLASCVGWMSHDAGMNGPAQQYFSYGIQAAHEAGTDRARLRAAGLLANLARLMQAAGDPGTAARLIDFALGRLPGDRRRCNAVRAMLWNLKAGVLAGMGSAYLPEVESALGLSFDLLDKAEDDEHSPAVADYFPYTCGAELASIAAACYRDLLEDAPRLAVRAEVYALRALGSRGDNFARSKVFDQVTLAQIRFRAGEPKQGCLDGRRAIDMSGTVRESQRVRGRLAQLGRDTSPYTEDADVNELRDQLSLAVSGAS